MVKDLKNVKVPVFDAQAFLDSAGVARGLWSIKDHRRPTLQGDPASSVMYVQKAA